MTFLTPDPIPSGLPCPIVEVGDHSPEGFADFDGEASFTIDMPTGPHRVSGVGGLTGDVVRFQEKDVAHDGKDVRTWEITSTAEQQFIAQHIAGL